MVDWKDFRPYLIRLSPRSRKRLAALPMKRLVLQKDLRGTYTSCSKCAWQFSPPLLSPFVVVTADFIRSIGPGLGQIYYKSGKIYLFTTYYYKGLANVVGVV